MSANTNSDSLTDRLSRYREIKISVIGRKSGRTISNPVWFVLEDDSVLLVRYKAPIHSGIRTCSTIPKSRLMLAAKKPS